ncbi:hypothetical protein PIB30_115529, partial [Stylosanthes scabra]|nr:hypothetical protein [Stylosanthes scabra]
PVTIHHRRSINRTSIATTTSTPPAGFNRTTIFINSSSSSSDPPSKLSESPTSFLSRSTSPSFTEPPSSATGPP